jgi:acyl carrier protein
VTVPAFAEVARVLADVLGVEPARIRPDSSPDTIEAWDSVQHLNVIIALEQEFGLRFSPEEIEDAVGVQAIVDLIGRKGRAG